MIEGRPRESLVLYDNPIEVTEGMDVFTNPHKKSFGSKCKKHSMAALVWLIQNWSLEIYNCLLYV